MQRENWTHLQGEPRKRYYRVNPANLMKHQVTTKKIVRMGNNISSLCASNNNNKVKSFSIKIRCTYFMIKIIIKN